MLAGRRTPPRSGASQLPAAAARPASAVPARGAGRSSRPRRDRGRLCGMPATALLILDMQNDGLSEGGAFATPEGLEHARRQGVVEHVRAVAAAARRAAVPVIHLHHVEEQGHRGTVANTPLFARLVDRDGYVRGTWGAEPVAGLEPEPGDVVVEKRRMSAFAGTSLDVTLRALGTTELILCG